MPQTGYFLDTNILVHLTISTTGVFKTYAAIDAYSESIGKPMGKNDVWIAASARVVNAAQLITGKVLDHLHDVLITPELLYPEVRDTSVRRLARFRKVDETQ